VVRDVYFSLRDVVNDALDAKFGVNNVKIYVTNAVSLLQNHVSYV